MTKSFLKTIFIFWVCYPLSGQNIPIYDYELNELNNQVLNLFQELKLYHDKFFEIPNNWYEKNCNERSELVKSWENKVKPHAYKAFLRQNNFSSDALVYSEAIGNTWNRTNILPSSFSSFLLSYFHEYNQFRSNKLCKTTPRKLDRISYFSKNIQLDSIGTPIAFVDEPGSFIPVFFRSYKVQMDGTEKRYRRVLIIKINKEEEHWHVRLHHLFNYVGDWMEHLSVERIPILAPNSEFHLTGESGNGRSSFFLNPQSFVIKTNFKDVVDIQWNILDERKTPVFNVWKNSSVGPGENVIQLSEKSRLMELSYRVWRKKREFEKWQLVARFVDGSKTDTMDIVYADPIVALKTSGKFIRNLPGGSSFFHGDMYPYADYFHGAKKSRENIRIYFSKYFQTESSLTKITIRHEINDSNNSLADSSPESLGYVSSESAYKKEVTLVDSLSGSDILVTFNRNKLMINEGNWKVASRFTLPIVWNIDRYGIRKDIYNTGSRNLFLKQEKNPYPYGKFTLSIYSQNQFSYEIPFLIGKLQENMLANLPNQVIEVNNLKSATVTFQGKISSQVNFYGSIERGNGRAITRPYLLPLMSDSSMMITSRMIQEAILNIKENEENNYILKIFPEKAYKREIKPLRVPISFNYNPGTVSIVNVQVSTPTNGGGEKARLVFSYHIKRSDELKPHGMIKIKQFYLGQDGVTPIDYDSAYYDPVHGKRIYRTGIRHFFSDINILLSKFNVFDNQSKITHVFRYSRDNFSFERFKFTLEYVDDWDNVTGIFEQHKNVSHIAYIEPLKWERSIFPFEPLFNKRRK